MTTTLRTPTVSTPTIRRGLRRGLFWIVIAVIALLMGVVSLVLAGGDGDGIPRSPDSPAPTGSKAVAQVLEDAGVEVRIPATYAAARTAMDSIGEVTLLVDDPNGFLDADRLTRLAERAGTVVLIAPGEQQLQALAPSVALAGEVDDRVLDARCSYAPAELAGSVDAEGLAYRVAGEADAERCFANDDGGHSVIAVGDLVVLGTTAAITNERVLDRGNAALALGALGQHERLVWYLPTIDDTAAAGGELASLTPLWVPSIAALAFVVVVIAGVWRGRRFGPLVVEDLPVLVRPTETMEGRARLYAKGSARLRALDALRVGTLERIAKHCGLPGLAAVDEVVAAASAATGRDPTVVRSVLLDADPVTDGDLVRLSDELLGLEHAVAAATRP